jgi:predicted metal-dependent phosphoesterase TrpH
MKYKVDLHVHSKYSGDNPSDPDETILHAIRKGLHGIVFTEHYSYAASEPIERLKEKYRNRIMVFRGVEFSSREGHCLVFGADTDKLDIKHAPIREVVHQVREAGGVVIPSHPYRSVNSIGDLVSDLTGLTAIEGYNGCNMHSFNVKAVKVAELLKLPFTGGSDAHTPRDVGSCFTEFDDSVTEETFIDLLKQGRYRGVDTRKISRFIWHY